MSVLEKRAEALTSAKTIVDGAKAAARELTDHEIGLVETFLKQITEYDEAIERSTKSADLFDQIAAKSNYKDPANPPVHESDLEPQTLGDHFLKTLHGTFGEKGFGAIRGNNFAFATPEWVGGAKAATDTQLTTGYSSLLLTDVDKSFVTGYRPPLTVGDLFGQGTISGNAITFFREGALEGQTSYTAENALKPQLHVANPAPVTETLKKVAGWVRFTDEMLEDLPYVVSEINSRLVYNLHERNEAFLVRGDGANNTPVGVLNRSGIQTEAAANAGDRPDSIFRAMTKVSTATGLFPDAVVMNAADYQKLRLAKDANGQYFGGGFFSGAYGNGGIQDQPNVWGLRTVISNQMTAGTAVVGAFKQSGTIYRKGGIRVEATGSDTNDFQYNRVLVRAENRWALAIREPLGFVKVTGL